jgi:hypothetical protein
MDWLDFCSALRRKRYKIPDSFAVVVWHKTSQAGTHQSMLLRSSSVDEAKLAFQEYMKRPAHARSFTSRNLIQLHGPFGLIENLQN